VKDILELAAPASWTMLGVALALLVLLVVSFRSRAYVFCQYLKAMAGIALKPSDVRAAFKRGGKEGVRELFLDLIIREDLKSGPIPIPEDLRKG
jgi:hypothetical protein